MSLDTGYGSEVEVMFDSDGEDYNDTLSAIDIALGKYESAAQNENQLLLMAFPMQSYEIRCGLSPSRDFSPCIILKQQFSIRSINFASFEWATLIDTLQTLKENFFELQIDGYADEYDPITTHCGDYIYVTQYIESNTKQISISNDTMNMELSEQDVNDILRTHMGVLSDRIAMLDALNFCDYYRGVFDIIQSWMEESRAFLLLRYLMFRRGMRNQYLPDMVSLQIKLYQLSRLVRDHLSELYSHFDVYEVAPTLYAAPWLLTVFASQFPLGFVTRVFDLLFMEGPEVIFRVSLALLSHHKERLLLCDSFEEIMNYLKIQLPSIDKSTLDLLMKQVFTTDIVKQLNEYKVEYQVLQEEMTSVQPQVEALHKLESQNKLLSDQNKLLMRQLETTIANVHRLEKTRALQQSQLNRLEMQNRGLNITIATMGSFINSLVEQKIEVEIPDDVQRIVTQLSFSERRLSDLRPQQNNLMRMFQKSPDKILVKSQSTGKINLPVNLNQNEFRADIIGNISKGIKATSTNNIENTSRFFSNSHNNILQQKLNAHNSIMNNAKVNITIQEFENDLNSNTINHRTENLPFTEEMEFENSEISLTNSEDSGVVTPVSPLSLDNHPLSNCNVSFTFKGTRELKTIKNIKNSRNCT